MNELLEEPRLWVAVAFVIFIALTYKKIGGLITRALDERSAKIKAELDQARNLRQEAEKLLADYRHKQAVYLREAESMLHRAREDANVLTRQAEEDLRAAMAERTKQAMEKIALAEGKAVKDVRDHVVDIALAATRAIIIEQIGTMGQDELVKLALSDVERKLH